MSLTQKRNVNGPARDGRARVEDDLVGAVRRQDRARRRDAPRRRSSRYGLRFVGRPGEADEVVLVSVEDDVRRDAARQHRHPEVRDRLRDLEAVDDLGAGVERVALGRVAVAVDERLGADGRPLVDAVVRQRAGQARCRAPGGSPRPRTGCGGSRCRGSGSRSR